jgi:molecular chaperone HscB
LPPKAVRPNAWPCSGRCASTRRYQRLKDPLKRAAYLCELAGVPVQSESNTAMPTAFLMQQMQWREALEEADTAAEVAAWTDEVQLDAKPASAV